jgi:cytochrome c peroxidase
VHKLGVPIIAVVLACRGHEPEPSPSPGRDRPFDQPAAVHQQPQLPAQRPTNQPVEHPASESAFYAATFAKRPSVAELTALGALAFRDPGLSASGRLACATCHDPDHAFAPSNGNAIQLGGPNGTLAGTRLG